MHHLPRDKDGNIRVWLADKRAYKFVPSVDAKELLANPKCAFERDPDEKAAPAAPVEPEAPEGQGMAEGQAPDAKPLTDMTAAQLRAFAKDKGVVLGADVRTKDDILAKLAEAGA